MICNKRYVKIFEPYEIDLFTLIGYMPQREIGNLELVIGKNAKIRLLNNFP